MKTIDLIIFDLDGTLYKLDDVIKMNYLMQLDFYSSYTGIDKNEVIRIFEENNIYQSISEKSKSATEFFNQSGIPIHEWNIYRETNFDVAAINKKNVINQEIIKMYNSIASLVLLSSNSYQNILNILNHIEISEELFKEIICSDHKFSDKSFKKIDEMKFLAERQNILFENIVSIGDRKLTDIDPMITLGGHGVLVNGPAGVVSWIHDYINGKIFSKSQDYSFY